MSYNGWTNKETWLVNLWLGEVLDMYVQEGVEVTQDNIKELVENSLEQFNLEGFAADMMNCALGEINYHEIASHYSKDKG